MFACDGGKILINQICRIIYIVLFDTVVLHTLKIRYIFEGKKPTVKMLAMV